MAQILKSRLAMGSPLSPALAGSATSNVTINQDNREIVFTWRFTPPDNSQTLDSSYWAAIMPRMSEPLSIRQDLHTLFECDAYAGFLVWKIWPDSHFATPRAAKVINSRNGGERAGCLDSRGYWVLRASTGAGGRSKHMRIG